MNRVSDTIVGVIGDHSLDKDYVGRYTGLMSREQEDMRIFDIESANARYSGGGAANIVDLLQAWNVRVLPCGVWNPLHNHNSRILYNIWMQGFVNNIHMIDGNGTPAFTKYYTLDSDHVFRANESVEMPSIALQNQLIEHIRWMANEIDILIVADYNEDNHGILTPNVLHAIRELIKCPKIGMSRGRLSRLKGYDYLIMDEEELTCDSGSNTDEDYISRADSLFISTKAQHLLVTLKGKGAALYDPAISGLNTGYVDIKETLVPSEELTDNINTCGCGDTFTAAFTICLASGMSEVEAMKRANAAARVQCRKQFGAHSITNEEWDWEYTLLYCTTRGVEDGEREEENNSE